MSDRIETALNRYGSRTFTASNGARITFDTAGWATISMPHGELTPSMPTQDLLIIIGVMLGFTQEHVDFLRFIAHDEWNGEQMEEGRKLFAIASRIAALLPPPPSTETRPDE